MRKERQTDRQMDRQKDRWTDRKTEIMVTCDMMCERGPTKMCVAFWLGLCSIKCLEQEKNRFDLFGKENIFSICS